MITRMIGVWQALLLVCTIALLPSPVASQVGSELSNSDFERLTDEGVEAWQLGGSPAFGLSSDAVLARSGSRSLRLANPTGGPGFGSISQTLDAAPYRGLVVRFRAAVRTQETSDRVGLWMRVDRASGRGGFFDNMSDRSIRSEDWEFYDIVGRVAGDASQIVVGLTMRGGGAAWIDTASLEILGDGESGERSAEPLTPRALENLQAFAQLYGYLRWFNPAVELDAEQWNRVALSGVELVQDLPPGAEIAPVLEEFFRPLAPGLQISRDELPNSVVIPATADLLRWQHRGIGLGGSRSYTSDRVPAARHEILTGHLQRNLHFRVPVTAPSLPSGEQARLADRYRPTGLATVFRSGDDRTTRLANVVILWNVFAHFYPYFDVVDVDWGEQLAPALSSAAEAADATAFHEALEHLVAALRDGHGAVLFEQPSYRLPLAWDLIEGQLVITSVSANTPLRVGEVVVSINGQPAAEVLLATQQRVSAATHQWRLSQALGRLRMGGLGEQVDLRLRAADGRERLERVGFTTPLAAMDHIREPRPEPISDLHSGIWYIDLTRVTDRELEPLWPRLSEAEAVIFDLRGYPSSVSPQVLGHLTDQTVTTQRFNMPIIQLPDGRAWRYEDVGWTVSPRAPRVGGRIIFLTDARAISYAETLLSIVEAYDLGQIVGGPTAGTNGSVNPFTLPGGYRISWTGMQVLTHDGQTFHGRGVLPTVPVERTIAGVRAGRDELLEEALRIVTAE